MKEKLLIKIVSVTALTIILNLLLTSCVPRVHNLDNLSNFVVKNNQEIQNVVNEGLQKLAKDEAFFYDENSREFVIFTNKEVCNIKKNDNNYKHLISFIQKNKEERDIRRVGNSIDIYIGDGDYIAYSNKNIDEMDEEFFDEPLEGDFGSLDWEKKVNKNNITFISDNRHNRESEHHGMYYRVDMKYLGENIYIYHLTKKYPWYSMFYA